MLTLEKIMEKWSVIENNQTKAQEIVYGGDEGIREYIEDCAPKLKNNYTKIPINKWNTNQMSEIIGDMLEDNNHHRMIQLPNTIKDCLKRADVPDDLQQKFFHQFMIEMFQRYD